MFEVRGRQGKNSGVNGVYVLDSGLSDNTKQVYSKKSDVKKLYLYNFDGDWIIGEDLNSDDCLAFTKSKSLNDATKWTIFDQKWEVDPKIKIKGFF